MTESVLVFCHRYPLTDALITTLDVGESQRIWEDQGITVREFTWKSIPKLCFVGGARHVRHRDTISTMRQVITSFENPKVIFICNSSTKTIMTDDPAVVIPAEWNVCVTVDELEEALGEELTQEQKRVIEQRHLPRPLPNVRRRAPPTTISQELINNFFGGGGGGGGGNVIRIRGGGLQGIGQLLFQAIGNNPTAFEEATRRSMLDIGATHEPAVNIRDAERDDHPWDAIMKDTISIEGDDKVPDEAICCVCAENYSTIQTVDIAGKCDHVVMCDACAKIIMDTTKKCPVCRAPAVTIRRSTVNLPTVEEPPAKKNKVQ